MIIFNILLSINSILVSSFAFLTFALYIYTRREDLLIAGLITGLAMTIYIFVVYYLFATAYPNYAENYWLLYDTALGASVLGKVPVTELLWYVAWGVFAGMFYPFVTGEKLENK